MYQYSLDSFVKGVDQVNITEGQRMGIAFTQGEVDCGKDLREHVHGRDLRGSIPGHPDDDTDDGLTAATAALCFRALDRRP